MEIAIGLLIIWIVCGVITAFMGSAKGRSGCGWFLVGFVLGPIGIIIAAIVKAKVTQPDIKLTVNYPTQPPKQQPTQKPDQKQIGSYDDHEHLQSLLKQATALKDSDIDTAIRIVKEVIEKYEAHDEPFGNLKPIYFKLANYLQKKGSRDEAWRIYNQMILKASQGGGFLILGMYLADIYSHMASLREKEKGYKDVILFKVRSYINKNEALHLQSRRKELLPVEDLLKQLKPLFERGQIKYPKKLMKKILQPLINEWKKKPPVKEPFIDSVKKREKIQKRYVFLTRLSKKQLNLVMEKIR